MIRLGLLGSTGRLGREIVKVAESEFFSQFQLQAAPRRQDALDSLLDCDLVIDVTEAPATKAFAEWALKQDADLPVWVIGTTGLDSHCLQILSALSSRTSLLLASNFSLGVHLLQQILESSHPLLKKWGFAPTELRETHHIHKKDKPSGTALSLLRLLSRDYPGQIKTESVREGEVIGRHEIFFQGIGETLSFAHDAQDRRIFARGALQLARTLHSRKSDPKLSGKILEPRDLLQL